jgi:hypothetical protein
MKEEIIIEPNFGDYLINENYIETTLRYTRSAEYKIG